jgi:hypothetical protein
MIWEYTYDIKVGDKVVCVHSEGIEHALTNGKRYSYIDSGTLLREY